MKSCEVEDYAGGARVGMLDGQRQVTLSTNAVTETGSRVSNRLTAGVLASSTAVWSRS